MPLIENELEIIEVKNLMEMDLKIPNYQRPYRWSTKSVNTLFDDIYNAFEDNLEEYRLGAVILHKDDDESYDIVDGQQRLTTLCLLLYALGYQDIKLLDEEYSVLSNNAIIDNYETLKKRVQEFSNTDDKNVSDNRKENFKSYIENNCKMVKIVTDREQEAFQFFDSQNARGKELKPHDLLKAYHLREMNNKSEESKVNIITRWEELDQDKLERFFERYLYPLTKWYKLEDGLYYSSSKIDIFKGISNSNLYNYGLYHKSSYLFLNDANNSLVKDLLNIDEINKFQLTEPIISGDGFFEWVLHYKELLFKVRIKIEDFENELNNGHTKISGAGDTYTRQLFESVVLFFVDRFGMNNFDRGVFNQLFTWSYSIRLVMHSVYIETINKYALGKHNINKGIQMFKFISEMKSPNEIKSIVFNKVEKTKVINKEKYGEIYDDLEDINGWQ